MAGTTTMVATAVAAMTTERTASVGTERARSRRSGGPDRLTTLLLAGTALLVVLGLLALQLRSQSPRGATGQRSELVVRRVVVTRRIVIERSRPAGQPATSTVTQTSSPAPAAIAAAPVTRAS